MSAFDARIRVGQAGVQVLKESEDGPAYEAELHLGIMTLAPVGPNQVLPIPVGGLRVPFDIDAVDNLIQELIGAKEQMSRRPNIEVASSLEGVDRAAQFHETLK
jgi:hypothetical protein